MIRLTRKSETVIVICGGLLLLWAGGLALFASAFDYTRPILDRPTEALIALMMAAALVYFIAIRATIKVVPKRSIIGFAVVVGALMRLFMFGTEPIYEDDSYRYLWDGAQVRAGLNPYIVTPYEARPDPPYNDLIRSIPGATPEPWSPPPAHAKVAREGGESFYRVAYPLLTSIYPPITEGFFALAAFVKPWSLDAWRAVMLVAEAVSLVGLFVIMRALNRSPLWVIVYWWNPLLVREVMNAGHMEAILIPFLLLGWWGLIKGRHYLSAIGWALAGAVKIWPLVLLPFAAVAKGHRTQQNTQSPTSSIVSMALVAGAGLVVFAAFLAPQLLTQNRSHSGLIAYTLDWQTNAFLFRGLQALLGDNVARLMVAVVVIGSLIWMLRIRFSSPHAETRAIVSVMWVFLLLSPTGYPWYLVWVLPFLCAAPSSLLLLTLTQPLYMLRFPLGVEDRTDIFQDFVSPLIFAPVIGLGFWRFYKRYRSDDVPNSAAA